MYLPKHFEPPDIDTLVRFIDANPFATLVTTTASGGLDANHLPLLFDPQPGPSGTLRGHVARANAVWRECGEGAEVLAIFQGPDSFITPAWYPTKQETGEVVPTWNYVVAHAHGRMRVIEDREWLRAHVEALTRRHETGRAKPWAVSDAPADYIQKLLGAIVGVEIAVTRLVGKWKVSQNRSVRDRTGVIEGLQREGTEAAAAMATLIRDTFEPR